MTPGNLSALIIIHNRIGHGMLKTVNFYYWLQPDHVAMTLSMIFPYW